MKEGRGGSFKLWYALSFALQLGFLVVVPLGGFILLGVWGDAILATSPLLLLVGAVVGVVVTAYEIYHMILSLMEEDEPNRSDDAHHTSV